MRTPRRSACSAGLALLVVAAFAVAQAHAAPAAEPLSAPRDLNGAETLVKIIAGLIAAVVALVGLPAAFLQFGKTRAEIKKLRLEAEKLASEIRPGEDRRGVPKEFRIVLRDSPGAVLTVQSDAGVIGPMLLITDFVAAYIIFQAWLILLDLVPLGGFLGDLILTSVRAIAFASLFIPVYANGRQVRALLRQLSERSSLGESASPPS